MICQPVFFGPPVKDEFRLGGVDWGVLLPGTTRMSEITLFLDIATKMGCRHRVTWGRGEQRLDVHNNCQIKGNPGQF